MFWVLKRSVSDAHFFSVPTTHDLVEKKEYLERLVRIYVTELAMVLGKWRAITVEIDIGLS